MADKENKDKNVNQTSKVDDKPLLKRAATLTDGVKGRVQTLGQRLRGGTVAKGGLSRVNKETASDATPTPPNSLERSGTLGARLRGRFPTLTQSSAKAESPVVKKPRSETTVLKKPKKVVVNKKLWHMLNNALDDPSLKAFKEKVEAVKKQLERGMPYGINEQEKQEIVESRMRELVNYSTSEGNTILKNAAIRSTHPEILAILVKQLGADINHVSTDGTTPLISAIMVGDNVRASFLVDLGADVNKVADNGFGEVVSPLIAAVSAANPDIELVELILKNNPDLSFQDIDGRAALDHAKDSRQNEIVDKLMNHQAKINAAKDGKYSITPSELKEIIALQRNLEENFAKCRNEKGVRLDDEDINILNNLIQGVYYIENRVNARKEIDAKKTPPMAEIKRRINIVNQYLEDLLSSKESSQVRAKAQEMRAPEKGPEEGTISSPKPREPDTNRVSIPAISDTEDSSVESMATVEKIEEDSEEMEILTPEIVEFNHQIFALKNIIVSDLSGKSVSDIQALKQESEQLKSKIEALKERIDPSDFTPQIEEEYENAIQNLSAFGEILDGHIQEAAQAVVAEEEGVPQSLTSEKTGEEVERAMEILPKIPAAESLSRGAKKDESARSSQFSDEHKKGGEKERPVSSRSKVEETKQSEVTEYQKALGKIRNLASQVGHVQKERENLRATLEKIGKSFEYQHWVAQNKHVQDKPSNRETVFMAIDKLDRLLKRAEKAMKKVEDLKNEGKKVPRILKTWESFTKGEVRTQLEKMARNPIKSALEGLLQSESEKNATARASFRMSKK